MTRPSPYLLVFLAFFSAAAYAKKGSQPTGENSWAARRESLLTALTKAKKRTQTLDSIGRSCAKDYTQSICPNAIKNKTTQSEFNVVIGKIIDSPIALLNEKEFLDAIAAADNTKNTIVAENGTCQAPLVSKIDDSTKRKVAADKLAITFATIAKNLNDFFDDFYNEKNPEFAAEAQRCANEVGGGGFGGGFAQVVGGAFGQIPKSKYAALKSMFSKPECAGQGGKKTFDELLGPSIKSPSIGRSILDKAAENWELIRDTPAALTTEIAGNQQQLKKCQSVDQTQVAAGKDAGSDITQKPAGEVGTGGTDAKVATGDTNPKVAAGDTKPSVGTGDTGAAVAESSAAEGAKTALDAKNEVDQASSPIGGGGDETATDGNDNTGNDTQTAFSETQTGGDEPTPAALATREVAFTPTDTNQAPPASDELDTSLGSANDNNSGGVIVGDGGGADNNSSGVSGSDGSSIMPLLGVGVLGAVGVGAGYMIYKNQQAKANSSADIAPSVRTPAAAASTVTQVEELTTTVTNTSTSTGTSSTTSSTTTSTSTGTGTGTGTSSNTQTANSTTDGGTVTATSTNTRL